METKDYKLRKIIAAAVLYGTGDSKTTLQQSITTAFKTASEKISAVKP